MPKRIGSGIELLADATRRRIIAMIAGRPMRSSLIAYELGLSRPATSRQLALLEDAGLVRSFDSPFDRRARVYSISPMAAHPIIAWLAGTGVGLPPPPGDPMLRVIAEIVAASELPTDSSA
jgi:DNA-binding transcriptional ArsR family regulator